MLEDTIDAILDQRAEMRAHRNHLLERLVAALESDPGWVQVYTVTNELHVPAVSAEGAFGDLLTAVLEVIQSSRFHCSLC